MRYLVPLLLVITLSGCLNPLSLLGGGGGPNVAANVQAGKENNQSVIDNSADVSGENVNIDNSQVSSSGNVETIKILNQDIPMWVIVLLVLGWMLPSPAEIWSPFSKILCHSMR